jgi:hypothetical protein
MRRRTVQLPTSSSHQSAPRRTVQLPTSTPRPWLPANNARTASAFGARPSTNVRRVPFLPPCSCVRPPCICRHVFPDLNGDDGGTASIFVVGPHQALLDMAAEYNEDQPSYLEYCRRAREALNRGAHTCDGAFRLVVVSREQIRNGVDDSSSGRDRANGYFRNIVRAITSQLPDMYADISAGFGKVYLDGTQPPPAFIPNGFFFNYPDQYTAADMKSLSNERGPHVPKYALKFGRNEPNLQGIDSLLDAMGDRDDSVLLQVTVPNGIWKQKNRPSGTFYTRWSDIQVGPTGNGKVNTIQDAAPHAGPSLNPELEMFRNGAVRELKEETGIDVMDEEVMVLCQVADKSWSFAYSMSNDLILLTDLHGFRP